MNNSFRSKMALKNIRNKSSVLGFLDETESFYVKEIRFDQKPDIQVPCKFGVMDTNVKCLCYPEVEDLGYFIIFGIRYECSLFW